MGRSRSNGNPNQGYSGGSWQQELLRAATTGCVPEESLHLVQQSLFNPVSPPPSTTHNPIPEEEAIHASIAKGRACIISALQVYRPLDQLRGSSVDLSSIRGCELLQRTWMDSEVYGPSAVAQALKKDHDFQRCVGMQSIEAAGALLPVLHDMGVRHPHVSVNLSVGMLHEELASTIESCVSPQYRHELTLECLETLSPLVLRNHISIFRDLHDANVRVGVDDVDAPDCPKQRRQRGNATIAQLDIFKQNEIPVHMGKLPGEFVCGCAADPKKLQCIENAVRLLVSHKIQVLVLEGGPAGVSAADITAAQQVIAPLRNGTIKEVFFEGLLKPLSRSQKPKNAQPFTAAMP